MRNCTLRRRFRRAHVLAALLALGLGGMAAAEPPRAPLLLQEMAWPDVKLYLEQCDMVILPMGSTEQHGPHLPLGTDFIVASEVTRRISARTGVLVAPALPAGYSEYHSGFPGTLSFTPEIMEQALFETVRMLMTHGFRRFLFFNFHGGNSIVLQNILHRISSRTEAVAIDISPGGPVVKEDPGEFFDWHAGVVETSLMLYLRPDLVRMDRAEKPSIRFTPRMQKLQSQLQKSPQLGLVLRSLLTAPEETRKGGSSREISSNGIWSYGDPKNATRERGEKDITSWVNQAVRFIETWRSAEK